MTNFLSMDLLITTPRLCLPVMQLSFWPILFRQLHNSVLMITFYKQHRNHSPNERFSIDGFITRAFTNTFIGMLPTCIPNEFDWWIHNRSFDERFLIDSHATTNIRYQIPDFRSRILDHGSRIQGPRILNLRTSIPDPGAQIPDPGSRTLDLGIQISDAGFRILYPGSQISDLRSSVGQNIQIQAKGRARIQG